jgi:hypothetical protein
MTRFTRPVGESVIEVQSKVATWIAERTGRTIYPQLGWAYLQKLDLVLREPRPQHQDAASEEEQSAWKIVGRGGSGSASRSSFG